MPRPYPIEREKETKHIIFVVKAWRAVDITDEQLHKTEDKIGYKFLSKTACKTIRHWRLEK